MTVSAIGVLFSSCRSFKCQRSRSKRRRRKLVRKHTLNTLFVPFFISFLRWGWRRRRGGDSNRRRRMWGDSASPITRTGRVAPKRALKPGVTYVAHMDKALISLSLALFVCFALLCLRVWFDLLAFAVLFRAFAFAVTCVWIHGRFGSPLAGYEFELMNAVVLLK